MNSIHEMKANKIQALLSEIANHILSHDISYHESVVRQCDRINENLANLVRYAETIDEKKKVKP